MGTAVSSETRLFPGHRMVTDSSGRAPMGDGEARLHIGSAAQEPYLGPAGIRPDATERSSNPTPSAPEGPGQVIFACLGLRAWSGPREPVVNDLSTCTRGIRFSPLGRTSSARTPMLQRLGTPTVTR